MPNDEMILLSFVFNLAGSRPLNLLVSPIPDNTTKLLFHATPRHIHHVRDLHYCRRAEAQDRGRWHVVDCREQRL